MAMNGLQFLSMTHWYLAQKLDELGRQRFRAWFMARLQIPVSKHDGNQSGCEVKSEPLVPESP